MTALPLLARLLGVVRQRFVVAPLSCGGKSSDVLTGEKTVWSDRAEREMSDKMAWSRPIWLPPIADNRPDWHQAD